MKNITESALSSSSFLGQMSDNVGSWNHVLTRICVWVLTLGEEYIYKKANWQTNKIPEPQGSGEFLPCILKLNI